MRKILGVVAILALTTACAGRTAQVYVQADTATVNALSAFKAEKDVRCDAGQIPASSCEAVSKAFVPVWDAYLEVNALVTAEAPLPQVEAAVSKFKAAGVAFKDAVGAIQGDYRNLLLDLVEQALRKFDR